MGSRRFEVLVLAGFAALALAAAPGESLLGGWRLAEQYYNNGQHNFAEDAAPLALEFRVDERGRFIAEMTFEDWRSDWPAWPTPHGPAPLGETTVRRSADGNEIEAEYRVPPPPGDDTFLNVRETCTVESAERMRCEVHVRFERHGEEKGGFTWRRFFARETGP